MNFQEEVKKSRKKESLQTDEALLSFLREKPGAISLYQLAQELGWSVGRVQKSSERLLNKDLIIYRRLLLGGRYLKLIVPTSTGGTRSLPLPTVRGIQMENTLAIPFDIDNATCWKDHAFIYALNSLTLGVSCQPEEEWHSKALFETKASLQKEDAVVYLQLPERVFSFYILNMADCQFSWSPKKDKIFITISNIQT